jgi:hypothetical protein
MLIDETPPSVVWPDAVLNSGTGTGIRALFFAGNPARAAAGRGRLTPAIEAGVGNRVYTAAEIVGPLN